MKRLTTLLVGIPVFYTFTLSAQTLRAGNGTEESRLVTPLRVGDRVPKDFWDQKVKIYHQGDTAIIDLKRYKGKPLLLDFWTTWCSSCLEGMPKLLEIQNVYRDRINILLVNPKFSKNNYVQIQGMKSDFLRENDLTTVFEDKYLTDLFPFAAIPYYIWINSSGRVVGGTFAQFVTNDQISSFLNDH